MGVGSILDEKVHDLKRDLMVYEDRRKIEGRLSGLSFQPINNDGIIFIKKTLDLVDGAGS
jgi:hypothetical protein